MRSLLREHRCFLVLALIGVAVRVVVMLAFRPGFIYSDAHTYLELVNNFRPFPDRVIGYAALLKVVSWFTSDTWLVAGVQHALGLLTAGAGYALLRRWGVSGRVASLAVLPVLLDAMQLVLEHSVLTDVFFDFVLLAAVAVLAWRPRPGVVALVVGGVLLGLGVLIRVAAEPVILSAVGYCLLASRSWRRRALSSLVIVAAFAVPLVSYAAWFHAEGGSFGLTTSGGRAAYMRTTGFVDCSHLDVPSYERRLCPAQPVGQRRDPTDYGWHHPDHTAGLDPPAGVSIDAAFRDFAFRAIRAQPGDYARIVLRDSLLTFAPVRDDRYEYGTAYKWKFSSWAHFRPSAGARPIYAAHGGQLVPRDPYAGWLATYGRFVYLPGPLLGVLVLLALAGLLRRDRTDGPPTRALIFLTLTAGMGVALVPDVTAQFVWRYVLPAVVLVPMAAALAWTRLRRSSDDDQPGTRATPSTDCPNGGVIPRSSNRVLGTTNRS